MRKLTSITHLSLMAALLLSLSAPVSAGRQPADAGRVDPLVLALAAQQPETLIDVIVQKAAADVPLAALIERLGGQVTWDLPLIGAVAARLPAAQARQLAAAPEVQSVALDAAVHATDAEAPAGLLREDFTIGVNVAAGAGAWSSGWDWSGAEWHELGEADGPVAGDVAVTSFLAGDVQGLRLQGAGRGLQGGADLSQAAAAQLSLAYRRKDLAGAADFVRVEASGDGGQTWGELGTLAGPATDESLVTVVYDLSGFVVADFAVRLVTAETFSPDARFYVDALQVEYQPLLAPAPDTHAEALTHQLWLPALQSASAEAATGVEAAALQLAPYTLRDDFTWMSYSNNSGTHRWKTNWIEADAAGAGALAGNIDIYFGELWLDDNPDTGTQPSLRRTADLSQAVDAKLNVSFRTTSGVDPDDQVAIDVSPDAGLTYTTLEVISGITGARRLTRSYPITAYASKDTVIRLRVLANYGAAAESFVVDSVEISFWNECHKCIDTARLTNSYVRAVGADRLWNEAPYLQGDGVTIAILDSGIAEHLDLQGESWSGRILDHVDFTGAWFPDDTNGHGSHVAGIVGGDGYASSGAYRGLAPRADLVDVRVTDDQGRGTTSGVVAGLQWVYDHRDFYNIRVVNLSLNSTAGGSYRTDPLNAAVEILWFNGIVVVTAAGNNGQSAAGQIFAPANDPFVITVGAVDDKGTPSLADDALAKFSAYGTTSDGFAKPDLVAPGKNIISLLAGEDSNLAQEHPANKVSSWAGNAYFKMSGTSVAAPMVAAAAAMLLEAQPGLTPDQVKYRLLATANKNWPGYSAAQAGAGYLDVYTAVHTATTASSNTGLTASQLLWTGGNPVTWGAVSWNSVSWNSVSWNSVSWNSVSWNSVSWNSDDWGP